MPFSTLLYIVHFIGMALSVGAATAKVWLVIRCRFDSTFIPAYIKVAPVLTRLIVVGMIPLTLTGIIWLVRGYDLFPQLIAKIILVGSIWVLGPIIDNVVEPKFRKLAPAMGETPSADFVHAQTLHLILEIVATLLFYIIIVLWMLR
ncbi:MAG TPA: hypothetical protein VN285_12975 [Candidatus Deferrimicrobium sp.]|nr:hypothetical protein [Candidatus Deferrimicrobium sp.]